MSSSNPRADYEQAFELKTKGNTAFKSGNLKLALKNYTRIFMHIGMNPCMNMSQIMGQGAQPPKSNSNSNSSNLKEDKDPLQRDTDLLRLTAFNNIAQVYAKMGNWEECKNKCTRVLTHDSTNQKGLFRRAKAYRMLGLYELAHADLKLLKQNQTVPDPAVKNELKLLRRAEKNADKEFYAAMKKRMQTAKRKRLNKKKRQQGRRAQEKPVAKSKSKTTETKEPKITENADGSVNISHDDTNENLTQNTPDTQYVWDAPADQPENKNQEPEPEQEQEQDQKQDQTLNANKSEDTGKEKVNENSKPAVTAAVDKESIKPATATEQNNAKGKTTNANANQPTMF